MFEHIRVVFLEFSVGQSEVVGVLLLLVCSPYELHHAFLVVLRQLLVNMIQRRILQNVQIKLDPVFLLYLFLALNTKIIQCYLKLFLCLPERGRSKAWVVELLVCLEGRCTYSVFASKRLFIVKFFEFSLTVCVLD